MAVVAFVSHRVLVEDLLMIRSELIQELPEHLESAEREARNVVKITDAHLEIDIQDAYLIQQQIQYLKETNGHRTVGFKAGLTSRAKMLQMGVASPVTGFLCD